MTPSLFVWRHRWAVAAVVVLTVVLVVAAGWVDPAQAATDIHGRLCPRKPWYQPRWFFRLLMGLRGCPA